MLHAVEHLDCPYVDLKATLLKLFTPKPVDNCLKLIHSPEFGNRRPIQLMEAMLALLPPGAEDNILFKTLYFTKLPKEVRGHVLANGMHLDSRELSRAGRRPLVWPERVPLGCQVTPRGSSSPRRR